MRRLTNVKVCEDNTAKGFICGLALGHDGNHRAFSDAFLVAEWTPDGKFIFDNPRDGWKVLDGHRSKI